VPKTGDGVIAVPGFPVRIRNPPDVRMPVKIPVH